MNRDDFKQSLYQYIESQFGVNAINETIGNTTAIFIEGLATLMETIHYQNGFNLRESFVSTASSMKTLLQKYKQSSLGLDGSISQLGYINVYYPANVAAFNITIPKGEGFTYNSINYVLENNFNLVKKDSEELIISIPLRQLNYNLTKVIAYGTQLINRKLQIGHNLSSFDISVAVDNVAYNFQANLINKDENSFILGYDVDYGYYVLFNQDISSSSIINIEYYTVNENATRTVYESNVSKTSGNTIDLDKGIVTGNYFGTGSKLQPSITTLKANLLVLLNSAYNLNNEFGIQNILLSNPVVEYAEVFTDDGFNYVAFVHDGGDTQLTSLELSSINTWVTERYSDYTINLHLQPVTFSGIKIELVLNNAITSAIQDLIKDELKTLIDFTKEFTLGDVYQSVENISGVSSSFVAKLEILPAIYRVHGTSNIIGGIRPNTHNYTGNLTKLNFTVVLSSDSTANVFIDSHFKKTVILNNTFFSYEDSEFNYGVYFMLDTINVGTVFSFMVYPKVLFLNKIALEDFSRFIVDKNEIDIT
jgi:hypothetical protein